jgi:hypothetical protein
MEMSGQVHAPNAITPGKPLHGMLGGPQSRSELYADEKNLLSLLEIEGAGLYYI